MLRYVNVTSNIKPIVVVKAVNSHIVYTWASAQTLVLRSDTLTRVVTVFLQYIQTDGWTVSEIISPKFPSTPFPLHYSLNTPLFNIM